ncbi:hypothetical protein QBC39DRAFT_328616 [Podospora conica]|nr:hypothetical protein QBC39DRAFT_328616 [Schizothecium conicum]
MTSSATGAAVVSTRASTRSKDAASPTTTVMGAVTGKMARTATTGTGTGTAIKPEDGAGSGSGSGLSSGSGAMLSPPSGGIDKGTGGQCAQCGRRRGVCVGHSQSPDLQHHQHQQHHYPLSLADAHAAITSNGGHRAAAPLGLPLSPPASAHTPVPVPSASPLQSLALDQQSSRPRRISKLKHRALTATLSQLRDAAAAPPSSLSNTTSTTTASLLASVTASSTSNSSSSAANSMEPPVLSFYGKEPVPLPTRFAHIKRALAAGREAEIEASWTRLLEALKGAVDNIETRGPHITPSIDFADIADPARTADFQRDLKRYGLGVVRAVVPRADAQLAIDETVQYLETKHDFKQPSPQDPTCFDFFWTPAQVRTRAHPRVLEAQRWAMSLWDNHADDRLATRFPIAYADRLRIHGANIGGVGPDKAAADDAAAADELAFVEQFGDFSSSTLIAQVDNGSLERWEPDGYGRGGTYDAVFRGEWEKYDPWDPTHRVSATTDLYNGYGACSIFRMYQGVVALSSIEPGLLRLLPMPKLATAYFLLRPFFSPKTPAPDRRQGPEWEAFLDASNWALDRNYSTIIHGAVPGHAQRLTERWHPHLHLRRTLVTIPSLQTGDYIVWHPDLAYHMTSNPNVMASRAPSPPPGEEPSKAKPVSILVYVPAAPLTQTNVLYLARQRKTFQRGHPGPDFDATGSGLGSEATHAGRPGETEIAEVGGPAGLQAMGLAPFDVAPTPPADSAAAKAGGEGDGDVEMEGVEASAAGPATNGTTAAGGGKSVTRAEADVARLANIILFPDRYDFYMTKRTGTRASTRRTAAAAKAAVTVAAVGGRDGVVVAKKATAADGVPVKG